MKRSEVLQIIDKEYDMFVSDWLKLDLNNEESIKSFIPLNERILSKLEEIGMYPPDTSREGHIVSEWDIE